MNLTSKSISSIDMIIKSNVDDHRHNDKIDGLSQVAFVHDRNDVISFGVIFLNKNNIEKNIPNEPIKEIQSNNSYDA